MMLNSEFNDASNFITIITVTYNAEAYILSTIKSIEKQNYQNFEHLIIDGNSTDRTIEIVRNYKINNRSIIIEEDKGLYDAMNKGLILAKGRWLIFLNAGDEFVNIDSLAEFANQIDSLADIIYGDVVCDYGDFKKRLYAPKETQINDKMRSGMCVFHNAILFRRAMHLQYPYYLNYKIAADYDAILRMVEAGINVKKIPMPVVKIETGAGLSYVNQVSSLQERSIIMRANKLPIKYLLMNKILVVLTILKTHLKKYLPKHVVRKIIKLKK